MLIKEPSLYQMKACDLYVAGIDAVNWRRILLRLRQRLRIREALARAAGDDAVNIIDNHPVVVERKPGRNLANLLVSLPLCGLLRFNNQVSDAHLFDEGHHFLSCSGAD